MHVPEHCTKRNTATYNKNIRTSHIMYMVTIAHLCSDLVRLIGPVPTVNNKHHTQHTWGAQLSRVGI